MAQKIQYAINDTEIFHLTGCLSRCDKYYHGVNQNTEVIERDNKFPGPSFQILFKIPSGRNELKEQVGIDLTYYRILWDS